MVGKVVLARIPVSGRRNHTMFPENNRRSRVQIGWRYALLFMLGIASLMAGIDLVKATLGQFDGPSTFRGVSLKPQTIDLGNSIRQSSPVPFSFSLRNESDENISILNLATGCGCTDVGTDTDLLSPGQTAKISGTFDPFGKDGRFSQKGVVVYCKADTPASRYSASFEVTGEIIPDFRVTPESISIPADLRIETVKIVTIEAIGVETLSPQIAGVSSEALQASIFEGPGPKKWEIRIRIIPKLFDQARDEPERVLVSTGNETFPFKQIPVTLKR